MSEGKAAGRSAKPRKRVARWTKTKMRKFLSELAQTGNITGSARAAGMSESSARRLKKRDPEFARGWGEALCEGFDRLEALLLKRALAGLDESADEEGLGKIEKMSERGVLSLLAHHRATVRELRDARAKPEPVNVIESERAARVALEAKLDEMRQRLLANDFPE